ncbi:MAG: response regulator [Gemmatimonadetes bacterium]|nr:response regulator [Gemmatimonadota bacterium]
MLTAFPLASLAPTHAHAFAPHEVRVIMDGIYARGDRLMHWFLGTHMLLALGLAAFHATWRPTLLVGASAWGLFALCTWWWPRRFITRAYAGVAQQAFVALHIFQMHGQAEQHFWYFTAFTMMIVYQDWRCMWPGAVLIILQHSIFAVAHNAGLAVHFFPEPHVDATKLVFHFGIALVHVALCGYWAHLLRLQTLGDAWRVRLLGEDQQQLEQQLTQLRASEAALFASSAAVQDAARRQRAILDNTTDLMWVKDADGRYTAVNTAFARASGKRVEEIEGRHARELVGHETAAAIEAHEDEVRAERRPITSERTVREADGLRTYEVTVAPVVGDQGELAGFAGTARDVTDRRRLERARAADAARMLEAQKLESLGLLAGGVAHDFNNLLAVIQANAELARVDLPPDSPARQPFVEIERSAQRAADLTRQMLAYAGKGRVVVTTVHLGALVRDTADLLRSLLSKKAALHLELAADAPPVRGDAAQLRQVVLNLVSNAAEAIGDRDGTVTVRITSTMITDGAVRHAYGQEALPAGRYVVLEVIDTGVGMSREMQQRIFDPFFSTKFVGRGLGLAAVLGILRSHDGAIACESRPGAGSCFRVHLPAHMPTPESTRAVRMTTPVDGVVALGGFDTRTTTIGADGGSPQVVLVVDDEPTLRALAARVLRRAGHHVVEAEDGHDALLRLEAHPDVGCVVLDMLMPRMNGLETLRALRTRWPALPVLLTSGYSDALCDDDVFVTDRRVHFMQKPYGARELLSAVTELRRRSAAS